MNIQIESKFLNVTIFVEKHLHSDPIRTKKKKHNSTSHVLNVFVLITCTGLLTTVVTGAKNSNQFKLVDHRTSESYDRMLLLNLLQTLSVIESITLIVQSIAN